MELQSLIHLGKKTFLSHLSKHNSKTVLKSLVVFCVRKGFQLPKRPVLSTSASFLQEWQYPLQILAESSSLQCTQQASEHPSVSSVPLCRFPVYRILNWGIMCLGWREECQIKLFQQRTWNPILDTQLESTFSIQRVWIFLTAWQMQWTFLHSIFQAWLIVSKCGYFQINGWRGCCCYWLPCMFLK